MEKGSWGDILYKDVLHFKSQKALEAYYEDRWNKLAYETGGRVVCGLNVSNVYQMFRERRALELLKPRRGDVILDVGCGNGHLAKQLASFVGKVIGIDVAGSAIAKAKEDAPKNCSFEKMNAEDLDFPDNSFDGIVCVELIEHVLNPSKVLKEIFRVLKPGGRLAITVPTMNTNITWAFEIKSGIRGPMPVSEHIHEWTYPEFRKLGEASGLKFGKAVGVVYAFPTPLWRLMEISRPTITAQVWFDTHITRFPRNSVFVAMRFDKRGEL